LVKLGDVRRVVISWAKLVEDGFSKARSIHR
jgi:hypothetical protein